MKPLEWKISAQIIAAGTLIGAIVAIIQGGPVLAEMIPYATKGYVLTQIAPSAALANVTRMDVLDFQIVALTNQLVSMTRQFRANDPHDPDNADLEVSIRVTQQAIDKKQREFNLIVCLIQQQVTCVQ